MKDAYEKITALKDGEQCYFNIFEEGGALCCKCNGMYLLFEVPQYGGRREVYVGTFYENQISDLIDQAFSWT